MTGLRTWWRRLGGLAAVWLVAALLAAPAMDALVCHDEGETYASAQINSSANDVAEPGHDDRGQTEPSVCIHGHCHHGVAFAAPSLEVALLAPGPRDIHLSLAATQHASLNPTGPDRPPRA